MSRLRVSFNKYIDNYINTRVVFMFDILMSFLASLVSILLLTLLVRTDLFTIYTTIFWLLSSLIASFILILLLKTYRIIIRHMSPIELSKFALLAFFKVLLIGLAYCIFNGLSRELFTLIVLDYFFTFFAFFLLRVIMLFFYSIIKEKLEERKRSQRILVYGVGAKSVSLIQRLVKSPHYNIVGFIQSGNKSQSHNISSTKVYYVSSQNEFNKIVNVLSVDAILFATGEDARKESDRIIKYAIDNGLKTLFAPPIDEMKDGKPIHNLRDIKIEDLLMRPEIKISMDEIIKNFRGKTVMVTGAAGSIGSELCRQLATFGIKELILYDNSETPMHNLRIELEEKFKDLNFIPIIGDVRLKKRLDYAFRKFKPQVVFHAAAYKHVPLMEENPCEAVLVNVAGSRNVADKCVEYGVEMMVMVSTDKAVNPTNIMGCTKRLAEIYVQALGLAINQGKVEANTKFVTTRFGNVLGSNGSVIPRFREQIVKGGPLTVTHPDITRFFMTIPEACRLVMEAATMSTGNQIFVFDMGESVKIDDLARRMISLAGFIPDVDIKIEYSGLRPGEKLYEEVLATNENTLPTDHSRIRMAKVRQYDYSDACCAADKLEYLSREVDIPSMVMLMKKIVPEFISKNSRFEEFDKK